MAYINFKYCYDKGLDNRHIITLLAIHGNANGDNEFALQTIPNKPLVDLFEKGLLTTVKPKRSTDTKRARLRLSKKGKEIVTGMTTPHATEQDEKIYEFLSSVFSKLEKKQASRNKILSLIASFRTASGISAGDMYKLCKRYVNDSEEMEFNHRLEYLLFKPEHAYSKFNLGDSRLWNYYLQNGIN